MLRENRNILESVIPTILQKISSERNYAQIDFATNFERENT